MNVIAERSDDLSENGSSTVITRPPYASGQWRSNAIVWLFAGGIVINLVLIWHNLSNYQILGRVLKGMPFGEKEASQYDLTALYYQALAGTWYVTTAIFFLMWVHRMHRNLWAFGIPNLKFTPGWSVGWYFIPFANLFKPFQAMRELYYQSNTAWSDADWQNQRTPAFIQSWWALFLLMGFVGRTLKRTQDSAESIGDLQIHAVAFAANNIIAILAGLLAIYVVLSIQRLQQAKAAQLGIT